MLSLSVVKIQSRWKRIDLNFWTVCFQVDHLEKETSLLRQSEGSNVVFKGIELPDGIAPSSTNIINSLNEYLIHILQVLKILHVNKKIIDNIFLNLVQAFLWILRMLTVRYTSMDFDVRCNVMNKSNLFHLSAWGACWHSCLHECYSYKIYDWQVE